MPHHATSFRMFWCVDAEVLLLSSQRHSSGINLQAKKSFDELNSVHDHLPKHVDLACQMARHVVIVPPC